MTPATLVSFDRAILSLAALACARSPQRIASLDHVLVARTRDAEGEGLLAATDGKRLHLSRTLVDGTAPVEFVAWIPGRALEALDALLRGEEGAVTVDVEGSDLSAVRLEVHRSGHALGGIRPVLLPEEDGMAVADLVRVVKVGSCRRPEDLVATLDAKALAALKVSSHKGTVLVAGASGYPCTVAAFPSLDCEGVPFERQDAARASARAARTEALAACGVRRRVHVQASYLQDAVRWVVGGGKLAKGETLSVYLSDPVSGGDGWSWGPLALEGRDRVALVMPVMVSS